MRAGTVWLGALAAAFAAHARVGDSLKQSEARYGGAGQEVQNPEAFILKNARNVVYRHGDWVITSAYIDGVTARIQYEKAAEQQPRARLSKEDVAEILEAEDAGGWTAFDEKTQKAGRAYAGERHPPPVLRSASGLTARYRVFTATVENTAAPRHEAGLSPQQKRAAPRARVAL